VLKAAGGTDLRVEGEHVHCDAEGLEPDAVCAALVAAGVRVFGFGVERPSLEDAFVALTGRASMSLSSSMTGSVQGTAADPAVIGAASDTAPRSRIRLRGPSQATNSPSCSGAPAISRCW